MGEKRLDGSLRGILLDEVGQYIYYLDHHNGAPVDLL